MFNVSHLKFPKHTKQMKTQGINPSVLDNIARPAHASSVPQTGAKERKDNIQTNMVLITPPATWFKWAQ